MLEVFSIHLDPLKHWFLLDSDLCGTAPKRFCESELFKIFADEVKHINLHECRDQNGGLLPKPKGKHDDFIFVGSTFAVVAGNIRRKDPSASKLLQSDNFRRIVYMLNGQSLICNDKQINNEDTSQHRNITTPYSQSLGSSCNSSVSSGFASLDSSCDLSSKLSNTDDLKRKRLAPKRLAPFFTSTPVSSCETPYKKRKVRNKAISIMKTINEVCEDNNELLSNVIARCCLVERNDEVECDKVIHDVFREIEEKLGLEKTFQKLIPDDLWQKKIKEMRVPDWQLLLLKLEVPISDESWQVLLNRTHLGKGGAENLAPLLLSKNSIKASKHLVFQKVEEMFMIAPIPSVHDTEKNTEITLPGYQVGLEPVIWWQIRDLHLQGYCNGNIQLNLKLDGRPFAGRSQVLVGIIPSVTVNWSPHSCKSFFPLAIANCKEDRRHAQNPRRALLDRKNICAIITTLNKEKEVVKKRGIIVDGKHYTVEFKVTLDLKALYSLLVKDDDPDFKLGGKGYAVEFCFFCTALRKCSCDLGPDTVCLEHLQETKANIGSFKGIRDDLTFLLEEDLTSINLCALHCELRNTEQLIASLGLQAQRIGSLKCCNEILSKYGPETSSDRITVQKREGQHTRIDRQNIKVSSFSGNTERIILRNIEEIVRDSLPHESLKEHYKDPACAKAVLLNKLSFCSQQIKYFQEQIAKKTFTRDFGKRQEDIPLQGSDALKEMLAYKDTWEKWRDEIKHKLSTFAPLFSKKAASASSTKMLSDEISEYSADVTFTFLLEVFTEWREIAEILRDKVYGVNEQHLIDVFDLKCKHWGLLLRGNFGPLLGTGDYGHMTIEHSSMLLRQFGSLKEYSNQSIESSHSLQRQLHSRATSNDRHGYATSIKQLLLHFYSERLLFFRLCVRKALDCLDKGKVFHFVGCGWSINHAKSISWSAEDIIWIKEMDNLLTRIFGADFLGYKCDPVTKVVNVSVDSLPELEYDHDEWEKKWAENISSRSPSPNDNNPTLGPKVTLASNKGVSTTVKTKSQHSNKNPVVASTVTSGDISVQKPKITLASNKGVSTTVKKKSQHSNKKPAVSSTVTSGHNPSQRNLLLYPDLKELSSQVLTRQQRANLILPPVLSMSKNDLNIVVNPLFLTNPHALSVRPSDTITELCREMLNKARKDYTQVIMLDDVNSGVAVSIDGLGVFDHHAIDIWNSASQVQKIKDDIKGENAWLRPSPGILSSSQCTEIKQILLDSKPSEEVLTTKGVIVDVHDLTTLVGERYLTGFVIDGACLKYKEDSPSSNVIFIPSTCQTWISSNDIQFVMRKILQYSDPKDLSRANSILTPINVNGNHWGLLCLDLKSSVIYYDDSMNIPPPRDILHSVEVLLESLFEVSDHPQFSVRNWNLSLPLARLGMPSQPSGSGSCGMAVVLTVRTFLTSATLSIPPAFSWNFKEMRKHRLMLMNAFVNWKTNNGQ